MKIAVILIMAFIITNVFACDINGTSGFLPENNLQIPVDSKSQSNMTKERFNKIIDGIDKHYAPIIKDLGATLEWERKWKSEIVNASANRVFYKPGKWIVSIFGGLARHPKVTEDALRLMICHEIGHHVGGAPKNFGVYSWSSTEGQADYFAGLKCLRRIFQDDDNSAIVNTMSVPTIVSNKCRQNFTLEDDISICIRSAMAGKSIANLYSDILSQEIANFETPDTSVVKTTYYRHPEAQCRLDTYFQAALCDKELTSELDDYKPNAGTCNRMIGYTEGTRPLCWFKPPRK